MSIVRNNKKAVIIATIHWFVTTILQVDRLFYDYIEETDWLVSTKRLYWVFLVVAWGFGIHAYQKIKTGDSLYVRGLHVFCAYLTIEFAMLLILWPGTWAWDDIHTLVGIANYTSWTPWQHIITGAYLSLLAQILPFPGGIIALQCILIALCVAFCITKLERTYNIYLSRYHYVDLLIKFLPFLLPPVLMYQFSGYRFGLYVYLEMTVLVIMACAIKEDKEWGVCYGLMICFLCIIVACWRTESFVYLPCMLLEILLVSKRVIPLPRKVIGILIIVLGFWGLNNQQKIELGSNNYTVVSLLRPCTELVRAADPDEDQRHLARIDKVVDVKVIHDNPGEHGEFLYWGKHLVRESYTDEDLKGFLKAFIRLSLKYPKVVIAERANLFLKGSGITGETVSNVSGAAILYDKDNKSSAAEQMIKKKWISNRPVFVDSRKNFIFSLGMRTETDPGQTAAKRLVWNSIIPIAILIYAWLKLLLKKKWFLLLVLTSLMLRLPIIVLTQPSNWIMYVLSFYLMGYVVFIYGVLPWCKEAVINMQKGK